MTYKPRKLRQTDPGFSLWSEFSRSVHAWLQAVQLRLKCKMSTYDLTVTYLTSADDAWFFRRSPGVALTIRNSIDNAICQRQYIVVLYSDFLTNKPHRILLQSINLTLSGRTACQKCRYQSAGEALHVTGAQCGTVCHSMLYGSIMGRTFGWRLRAYLFVQWCTSPSQRPCGVSVILAPSTKSHDWLTYLHLERVKWRQAPLNLRTLWRYINTNQFLTF